MCFDLLFQIRKINIKNISRDLQLLDDILSYLLK